MPLNISTDGDSSKISYGPAVVKYGVVGATPAVDIGFVNEDGVTVEAATEMGRITQGNPKTLIATFNTANTLTVGVTGIEWNFENFARGLNAGETTVSGSEETFEWGGDPCPDELSLQVVHQFCDGTTLNLNVWRAVGQGNLSLAINHDVHAQTYTWEGMRSTTRWDGTATPTNAQLIQFQHLL